MLTMKQNKQEWMEYRDVMDNVVKKSGLNKGVFYDLRCNHDSFGVPFVGDSSDFYSNYSLNALLGRPGRVNSVTLQTEGRRHVFVGFDSSMVVGLRGPTNLFAHPTDELLSDMDSELSQWNSDPTKPVTKISFDGYLVDIGDAVNNEKLENVNVGAGEQTRNPSEKHKAVGRKRFQLSSSKNDVVSSLKSRNFAQSYVTAHQLFKSGKPVEQGMNSCGDDVDKGRKSKTSSPNFSLHCGFNLLGDPPDCILELLKNDVKGLATPSVLLS